MAAYLARVDWRLRDGEDFLRGRYSRGHTLTFDGGLIVPASASPHVVPLPWSVEAAVDPEELFTASLANCHMLWFLHKAREAGFVAAAYTDEAEGVMGRNAAGQEVMTRVTLRPRVEWTGASPDAARLAELHHAAHEACFIANSVKTEVVVEPA
ncbi:MAG TPA: OsmC family protein [Phenylobacterium sp.]|nr:OsmC family protein [Phenylobacterium sp.]